MPRLRVYLTRRKAFPDIERKAVNFLAGSYFNFVPTTLVSLATLLFFLFAGFGLRLYCLKRPSSEQAVQKILWYLLGIAFFIRIGYVIFLGHYTPELIDGFYQRAVGMHEGKGLVNIHGYPTALWMPGASLVYLAAIDLFGKGFLALFVTQTLAGFCVLLIVYLWGRILLDKTTGLLAACILGFFPSQIILETFGMSDLIFQASLWGGLLAFIHLIRIPEKKPSMGLLTASGLLLGLALLTRPYGLFFILLFFLWNLYLERARKAIFKARIHAMAMVLGMIFLVWGTWIVRNETIFHHLVPLTTTSGINLWVAHHPGASGKLEYLPGPHPFLTSLASSEEEYNLNHRLGREALHYIFNRPALFFYQIPKKWILLFASDTSYLGYVLHNELKIENPLLKNGAGGFANGYYLTFLLLAFIFGMLNFKSLVKNPEGNFGIILFFSFLAIFAVFHIETRFHLPLIPAVCLYSACFFRKVLLPVNPS